MFINDEIELSKGLQVSEWESLFSSGKVRTQTYSAGSMIFTPYDSSYGRLYLLKKGRVKLYRLNAKGHCMVFTQIDPGTVFGFRGVLNFTFQRHFAEAVEDSEIDILTRDQVLTNLREHPELIVRVLELLCTRLSFLEEQLLGVAYSSSLVRLAYFLLENTSAESGLLNNYTHEEIGNRIGVVRQTVTENLNYFRKLGIVSIKPKQIRILDRSGLEKILWGKEPEDERRSNGITYK